MIKQSFSTHAHLPAVLTCIVLLTGCTTNVKPWERGHLAKSHMALEPEPTLSTLREHVHVSKEASSGGTGVSGGGCGCN